MTKISRRSVAQASIGVALAATCSAESLTSVAAREQPSMENALRALRTAMEALERTAPNKGGYRERAMRHISEAMREVREGMAFANGY